MAGSATATAGSIPAAPAHAADRMDPKRLIAFFAMVLGMFMSILDIQIVSASLAEIQAGLSAGTDEIGWVQTAYLIAEVIMIPLSGTLARIISTRYLFAISAAGFTMASASGRNGDEYRPDDRLPCHSGLHRRRHDPLGLRGRLHDLPAVEACDCLADHWPHRDAGADHRPDGRRLPEPCLLLALAVPGQYRARYHRHDRHLEFHRFRQAGTVALQEVRLVRPAVYGCFPWRTGICAGRRQFERLVQRQLHRHRRRCLRRRLCRLFLPGLHGGISGRRSHGLCQPQFLLWFGVLLRHGHRPLRAHLYLSGLSRPHPRLRSRR